eukprot:3937879-Rhodomonas_salina.1
MHLVTSRHAHVATSHTLGHVTAYALDVTAYPLGHVTHTWTRHLDSHFAVWFSNVWYLGGEGFADRAMVGVEFDDPHRLRPPKLSELPPPILSVAQRKD